MRAWHCGVAVLTTRAASSCRSAFPPISETKGVQALPTLIVAVRESERQST